MEITCVEDSRYYIPWPWTRNATLFYRYLFRGRPIPRKHDPYIQAWHPLFWNWNVSIRMRSEIRGPGICMIRNVFEGFYSFWPFTGYFLPYRRGRKFKNVEADRWEMQRWRLEKEIPSGLNRVKFGEWYSYRRYGYWKVSVRVLNII